MVAPRRGHRPEAAVGAPGVRLGERVAEAPRRGGGQPVLAKLEAGEGERGLRVRRVAAGDGAEHGDVVGPPSHPVRGERRREREADQHPRPGQARRGRAESAQQPEGREHEPEVQPEGGAAYGHQRGASEAGGQRRGQQGGRSGAQQRGVPGLAGAGGERGREGGEQ
ncbi:MAG: hypothetical protein IPF99_28625 [Deltaproteobacteria bacterium]|nr:hypothetical protein [Deltaproteobacteria bacterium]